MRHARVLGYVGIAAAFAVAAVAFAQSTVTPVAPDAQVETKPLVEAKGEAMAAADIIEWFAEEGFRVYGRIVPSRGNLAVRQMVLKDPVGPVAAFTPWNFPINQVVRKVGAALAAGCSMLVKAPEETPAGPAELIRAFQDAGIPPGVLGLVYGGWKLLPFVVVGAVLVYAYNLELFGGVLHSDVWFAVAWGAFPTLVGAYAQHWTLSLAAGVAGSFDGSTVHSLSAARLRSGPAGSRRPARRADGGVRAVSGIQPGPARAGPER